ncbi:MAG TPA: tRNA 2-thiouridine(34) synthase MnmA [Steroidobacteraceae bacterium]|nr:tRNA 2-thiouridine(34) synthase MnmA [Steroidobacteraceae bacterium]
MNAPLVIVGMSGGVDSSVAAHLLIQQGFRVEGLFMSNWEEDEDGYCTSAEDYQDARQVCTQLDIPLHKISFATEYRDRVFAHFLAEYKAGRTPNPDVLCNREIKFGVCFEHATQLGADYFATGHYARVTHHPFPQLLRGLDQGKDQSYFLHAVSASALQRTLFPIGELQKSEVRKIAKQLALPTHDKKDSTGICFIGERPFAEFLERYLPAQPGEIRTMQGELLGKHRGLMYYTLGQRHGLGIGGQADHPEAAWYVAGKDLQRNVLIVVQGHDHPALQQNALTAVDMNWIQGAPPDKQFACTAKVRYRQADQSCHVECTGDEIHVRFEQPQRAVTPGQYVVLYDNDVCLGGGVIATTTAS